jgi:pSer/pThr/pTyr-binding forkhead associated (FHA) protein
MKLSLVVLSQGKAEGQTIPVNLSQFIIGRDPQCQLRPASPVISKRHCAVLLKSGKVVVRDFDSTNGTFVNEEPVKGEREIKDGDILKVGPLTFRVKLEGTVVPVDKPTPPPQPVKAAASEAPAKAANPKAMESDDDIAAMLLSLQEEGGGVVPDAASAEIPSGTTVMDLPALGLEKPAEDGAAPPADGKPAEKKPAPKKDQVSSSSAAAALLQKMSRRNRT